MSDILSIGASGLRAYQTALTTVSENIANASTAGYTRRITSLKEVSVAGRASGQNINSIGVMVSGVERTANEWRTAAVRTAGSDLARSDTSVAWLERIESSLTDHSLDDRITEFFNAAKSLAADPSATAPRSAMLAAASTVATSFQASGRALDGAASDLDATAETAVSQLNTLSGALAKINVGLSRTTEPSSGRAQLLDDRDRVLEQMAAITDLNISYDGVGRATVRGGDQSGPVLVQGASAALVTYVRNDEGAVSYSAYLEGTTSAVMPSGGSLAGFVEGAQRIVDAREALNTIATDFVTAVNTAQTGGEDLTGAAGTAMFNMGDTPTDISLALTDPRGIAAAAVGGGPRDNSNLVVFETARTTGKFEKGVSDLVTNNASALSGRRHVADAQAAIRDNAVTARESVSGVNLDEEAVDLLRFQQAYQASSRVIQIARETLNSIFEIL